MTNSAYIKLTPASKKQTITLDEVKELFQYYKQNAVHTAKQINWEYEQAAFPYELKVQSNNENTLLSLVSSQDRYKGMLLSIHQENSRNDDSDNPEQTYIKITLPAASTYGDKGKANEFCKFLAKKLEGELHLFNGRIMYYYRRK